MLKNYRTDVPLETFQAMTYVSLAMGAVFGFLWMGGAAPSSSPSVPMPSRRCAAEIARPGHRCPRRPAAATGIALAVQRVLGILGGPLPRPGRALHRQPGHHRQRRPALAAIANAVFGWLTDAACSSCSRCSPGNLPGR